MSKKQSFTVTLTFADKITDDKDVLEIASNIARAIKNECNGVGISPENGDTYTVKVEVTPQFIEETIEVNIID